MFDTESEMELCRKINKEENLIYTCSILLEGTAIRNKNSNFGRFQERVLRF